MIIGKNDFNLPMWTANKKNFNKNFSCYRQL